MLFERYTQSAAQSIVKRVRIILMANGEGKTNQEITDQSRIRSTEVKRWTQRWIERALVPVEDRFADALRSGRPDNFNTEQWCAVVALAYEPPESYERPITHWTSREFAQEVIKQGIVETISAGHSQRWWLLTGCRGANSRLGSCRSGTAAALLCSPALRSRAP